MALPATDDFNRADTFPGGTLGANWTNQTAGLQIFSNEAIGSDGNVPVGFWNVDSFPNDQYSKITIGSAAFSDGGPTVRASATGGSRNYYYLHINSTATEIKKV